MFTKLLKTCYFALAMMLVLVNIAEAAEAITIAVAKQPASALMHIAIENNYFADEQLNIKVTKHASGKRALLDGMVNGDADVVTAAEVPPVFRAFVADDFKIIATSNTMNNMNRVVARRDSGINKPSDIKGKRVATQNSSAVHYFLYLFMLKHDMLNEDVKMSFMKADKLPNALADNKIDAFSMREPYISQAVEKLGNNAIVFAEPGLFPQYDVVLVNKKLNNEPEVMAKVIRALYKAQEFARNNPVQAINIVAKFSETSVDKIRKIWNDFTLKLELSQAFLLALESEAEWIQSSGFIANHEEPDMLHFIDGSAMKLVLPEAYSIID
ncbi:MAG: NrtA/SsuA/CpmA family ABC transporter substrate-binding protein [Gammaproteobacteria bacterium]|nr:NrtA/SsuA/CpmA family ABC transporter substrate-binding protein [Gammaproteobacteria bacterium]